MSELTTERLVLRNWRESDRDAFFEMNSDPEVMRFFDRTRSRAEADDLLDRLAAEIDEKGYGFWAMERRADGRTIGFTGLRDIAFKAAFAPAVEIGWRLVRPSWGQGYASEAARTCLAHGFRQMRLDEIVSYAAAENHRSRRVMQRIGMRHEAALDFDHPDFAPGSPLARCVFYRLAAADWREKPAP